MTARTVAPDPARAGSGPESGSVAAVTGTRTDGPAWVRDVPWWHVHPLGFVGAEHRAEPDAPVRHRPAHLVGWLDDAVELGASGIALGPVFASSTHGYDTVDHLDPRRGRRAPNRATTASTAMPLSWRWTTPRRPSWTTWPKS